MIATVGVTRYVTQVFNVPFVWKFLQTPHLFAATTFGVPGGVAPSTISNIGFSVNQSNTTTSGGTTTTPIPTPTPAATVTR